MEHQDEYEHFLYQLLEGEDLATRINILKTFASLKTCKPLPDILNLLTPDVDASLRIAILRYVDELDFKEFDPFLQYRTIEMLKDICLNSFSNVARAMAIKTFVQHAAPEASVKFVMQELESDDDRIVANAIDGLRHLSYPGVVSLFYSVSKARNRSNSRQCHCCFMDLSKVSVSGQSGLNDHVLLGKSWS